MHLKKFRKPQFVLMVAFALYLFARLMLTLIPVSQRSLPIEPDDSYAFIQRAAQIQYCWLEDCRALDDVSEQVTMQTQNTQTEIIKNHFYHRTIPFIYPLHSGLIFLAHLSGATWETSYLIVSILCALSLAIAITYLLRELFGDQVTSICLVLLAGYIFRSDLLHSNVPQSWAMAAAFFSWAIILDEKSRRDKYIPYLLILPSLFHPSGPLYSTISSFLLLFSDREDHRKFKFFLFGMSASALTLFIQTLSHDPTIASGVQVGATEADLLSINRIAEAANAALAVIHTWTQDYWGAWIILPLSFIGYLSLENKRRKNVLRVALLVGALLTASILAAGFLRGYPPDLFSRLWVVGGLILAGLLGQSIWHWITVLLNGDDYDFLPFSHVSIFYKSLVAILIFLALFDNSKIVTRNYFLTLHSKTIRGNRIVQSDIDEFLESLDPEICLLYGNETIFHYAFIHGASNNKASYLPVLLNTEHGRKWLSPDCPQYVLEASPLSLEIGNFFAGRLEIISDNGNFVLAKVANSP